MSFHRLIYGDYIEEKELENIKEYHPFKIYRLDKYGDKSGDAYIGFEFGIVNGLYEKLNWVYDGCLNLTNGADVPKSIIEKFSNLYPNKKGNYYALIDNVKYTSHYVNGMVMYGYKILLEDGEDNNQNGENKSDDEKNICKIENSNEESEENIDNETDDLDEILNELESLDVDDIKLNLLDFGGAHNAGSPGIFIGKILCVLDTNECPDSSNELYKQLTTSYKPVNLPSREKILSSLKNINTNITISELPMLFMNQTMCHCCT